MIYKPYGPIYKMSVRGYMIFSINNNLSTKIHVDPYKDPFFLGGTNIKQLNHVFHLNFYPYIYIIYLFNTPTQKYRKKKFSLILFRE